MRFLDQNQICNWDAIIDNCDEIEGLDEKQKTLVKEAFSFLKNEFGENFLFNQGKEAIHPFFDLLINHVSSTRLWFVDLVEALQKVKTCENYNELLKRLKNPKLFNEAKSVLDIAIKFLLSDLQIEFDCEVLVDDRMKKPDIRIINPDTRETFYCEVSISNKSDIQEIAEMTEITLFNATFVSGQFLEIAGRIEKTLTSEELQIYAIKVNQFANNVAKEIGFGELIINGVLTLGLSTKEKKSLLEEWAARNNCMVGSFDGPPFNSNELQRMREKIFKEQKQLPKDVANLIMVYDTDFFYGINNMIEVIDVLEKFVYKHNHVLALIIKGGYTGQIKPILIMREFHMYLQKGRNELRAEQYLIIWNHFCKKPVSPATMTKIYRSIREY